MADGVSKSPRWVSATVADVPLTAPEGRLVGNQPSGKNCSVSCCRTIVGVILALHAAWARRNPGKREA